MSAREDYKWTDEAKNLKEGLPPNHKRDSKKSSIMHLKIDRSTLPKDGQRISFQTQNEEWHEGYFVSGDDLFWVNESKWFNSFDIISWKEA